MCAVVVSDIDGLPVPPPGDRATGRPGNPPRNRATAQPRNRATATAILPPFRPAAF